MDDDIETLRNRAVANLETGDAWRAAGCPPGELLHPRELYALRDQAASAAPPIETRPTTAAEVSAALTACGLEHEYVNERGLADDRWRIRLHRDNDCTYDTLRKIAERFGTTDLRIRHVAEQRYSEATSDPSESWLEIRGAKP